MALTQEQINQIRAKDGLKPVQTVSNTPSIDRVSELDAAWGETDKNPSISQLFRRRVEKGADVIEKGAAGERTNLETGLGLVGQGAGFIGDLAGKAISAVTPDPIGELALKPVKAIAESPVGEFVGETYSKLPERAKENIGAVANIAGIAPIGKGAQLATKGATKAVSGTAKGTAILTGEALGKTTGAGGGTLRAGFEAVREGGDSAKAFSQALKGELSPEQIVDEAKGALGKMKQQRTDEYVSQLEKLKQSKETLDVSPVVKEVDKQLGKFGISKTPQGLDFSRSTLRFDKKAQQEIETIVNEMASFGLREGDRSVIGVDSLKRALSDLYSDSSSARAFTQAVKSKTSDVLKKVEGYEDLTKNYASKTDVINDVTKALSLGDKASVDTAFKKLNSSLRTNNEARQQLIKELDEVAGTKLSAKIAGQQLSERLPRGLMGTVASSGVIGGAFAGMSIPLLLTAAVTTSPRAVGRLVQGLGYTARQTDKIVDYLRNAVSKPSAAIPSNANNPTANINSIPSSLQQVDNVSSELSTEKGMFQSAIDNLKDPSKRQGGYIANPLSKKPSTKDVSLSSVNNTTDLLTEAKKYKSAEEFVKFMRGSSTQYGEYNPKLRAKVGLFEDSARLSDLGVDPNKEIVVYRGIDGDISGAKINDGDFVTTDLESARGYSGGKVLSKKVKAKDLIADSAKEFDVNDPFYTGAEFVYSDSKNKLTNYTKSQLEDIWKQAQEVPKTPSNFTPELKKNIEEIIDSQRGITKVSPERMIELEADMSSIIEDFGFPLPKTKSGMIKILEMIYNGEL